MLPTESCHNQGVAGGALALVIAAGEKMCTMGSPHVRKRMLSEAGSPSARRVSARLNAMEEIVIEFDRPQRITRMTFEAEELHSERTQQRS